MRRPLLLLLAAFFALAAPTALAGGGGKLPKTIALPNGFAPEGIELVGTTAFVGSVGTGAVWKGDVRTGRGDVFVPGAAGQRSATGIEYDRGRLWVAGARFGNVLVYSARTGELLHTLQLATGTGTFVNDLVVTRRAVWLTDSQRPVLYRVELRRNGEPGAATTVPLSGDYQHVAGQFNLNGIVATHDGETLIAVQSFARKLYAIDTDTGAARLIDLGGYDLTNGDGLLLVGRLLFVVQNRDNKVAAFWLSRDLRSARFVTALTDPALDVPATVDRAGLRLYAVNARFGTTTPTDQAYHIVRLP
jgi:hypothetical protein